MLVTENVKDFARAGDVLVLCVLKSRLGPAGMAEQLAALVSTWASRNPEPYVGLHRPG